MKEIKWQSIRKNGNTIYTWKHYKIQKTNDGDAWEALSQTSDGSNWYFQIGINFTTAKAAKMFCEEKYIANLESDV